MKTWMFVTFYLQVFWSALVGTIVMAITHNNGLVALRAIAITFCVVFFGMLLVYGFCKTAADADRHIDEAREDVYENT
jgi:choline-glycine betaine transporter